MKKFSFLTSGLNTKSSLLSDFNPVAIREEERSDDDEAKARLAPVTVISESASCDDHKGETA